MIRVPAPQRLPQSRRLVALAAVPLALTLAACGGTDDTTDTSAASSDVRTSAPAEPTSPAASPSDTPSASAGGQQDAALVAAATALAKVDGTRVVAVERETNGWEVHVAATDGTESELRLSADGRTITRGPVSDAQDDARDDARDDADDNDGDDRDDLARDRAENARLLAAAKLDHAAAVEAARSAVSNGALSSLDLDVERGKVRWDVTFGDDTAEETTVRVDAASGAVLGTERDD